MTAKVLKVSAHCSWRLGDSLAFGAGLAWVLRDERVPHAGVPEIVTRSSLNPQDYDLRGCGSAVAIATSFHGRSFSLRSAWQCAKGTSHACRHELKQAADWAWLVGVAMISGTPA